MAHAIVHGLRGTALLAHPGPAREFPRARLLLTRFLKRLPSGDGPAAPRMRSSSVPRVHPSAVIDPKAVVGDDCEIGPFCIVGPDVVLGAGNRLESHVVITGHTTIGADNQFFPYAVVGSVPQDKKYRGADTRLVIGDRNVVREAVTMHAGTEDGGGVTRVGNDNLVMVNCHVGHDCLVGSHCILGNNVMLAGHTVIEDHVTLSGGSATNSFTTIGQFAYIAAMARIHHDVPPFLKVSDDDKVRDVNAVGLRRGGVGDADIEQIEVAARQLFFAKKHKKPFAAVLTAYDADPATHPRVQQMVAFLRRRDTGRSGRYLESLRSKSK